jgi:hypothetical protein
MSKWFRLVIKSVLVGGAGCVSGGMLERSKLREDLDEPLRSSSGRSGDEGEVGEVGEAVGDRESAIFCNLCSLVLEECLFRDLVKEDSGRSRVVVRKILEQVRCLAEGVLFSKRAGVEKEVYMLCEECVSISPAVAAHVKRYASTQITGGMS